MGRKKKVKNNTNTISYRGNVTVQVLHGNKVVSTRKVHNTGRMNLFKFITYCLGNNYYENMAPRYLRTFYCDREPVEPLQEYLTNQNEKSDIISFSSITYDDDLEKNISKVNLSFLIPGTSIFSGGESKINTLCLYSPDTFNDESRANPIAIVYLNSQDEINYSSGVNLVIIWELSIGNQVKKQQE